MIAKRIEKTVRSIVLSTVQVLSHLTHATTLEVGAAVAPTL